MKRLFFAAAFLLVLVASGCGKPENPSKYNKQDHKPDPVNPAPTPPSADDPYFTVTISDVINTFSQLACDFPYETNISADDISASASESWCSVQTSDAVISIRVEHWGQDPDKIGLERYPSPRSCTVSLKAGTIFSKTITVVQESDAGLLQHSGKVMVNPAGETLKIDVETNCISWNAKTDTDWITLKVLDNSTLQITSSVRPDSVTENRKATVVLTSDVNSSTTSSFVIEEKDSQVSPGGYPYDEHSNWD